MGFLGQEFKKDDLPESTSYDPIPAGWYNAVINSAEVKDAKSGGKYINVRYDVTGPSHEGRVVFGMITIQNQSQKAEEIGRQQLGDMMGALGLATLKDTDQLVGGRLAIKVKIQKSEEYGDQNRVSGWKAVEGGQLPKPATEAADKPAGGAPW